MLAKVLLLEDLWYLKKKKNQPYIQNNGLVVSIATEGWLLLEQLIIVLGELTRVAGRCNPSCCQTICRNEVVGRIRALLDAPFAKLRPYKRFTWNRNWPLHNKSFQPTHKKITLIKVLYSCLKPSVLLLFFFFSCPSSSIPVPLVVTTNFGTRDPRDILPSIMSNDLMDPMTDPMTNPLTDLKNDQRPKIVENVTKSCKLALLNFNFTHLSFRGLHKNSLSLKTMRIRSHKYFFDISWTLFLPGP